MNGFNFLQMAGRAWLTEHEKEKSMTAAEVLIEPDLKKENERLKQNIINLKYKWSKIFAVKRYGKNKNWIRVHIAEQAELLTDIEQTLNTK